jgi:hypothetical protein
MKFYGNANLQHNQLQNAELTDNIVISPLSAFPVAHGAGHITFVNDVLYICSSTTPTDVWIPLTTELTAYSWEQSTPSDSWEITHNLNTADVGVIVYDSTSKAIVPDEILVTGVNTVTVTFSSLQTGKAVVITGKFDGPPRTAPGGELVVSWDNVTDKPSFSTVATSGNFNDLSNIPTLSNIFVVAKNGNDTTGNGSFNKPFATIQKAHDIAESTLPTAQGATILIMPGAYTEALAITRPRTAFVGYAGFEWSTIIQTAVTITPSRRVTHPGNSQFSFENIFFNVGTGQNALTYTGSSFSGMLNLDKVRIYTTSGKGVLMNNTAQDFDATVGSPNNRMRWRNVDIQTHNGNQNTIELQNVSGTINDAYLYSGTAQAAILGLASNVTFTNTSFEAGGAKVASVSSGGTMLVRGSSFRNTQNDGDGVDVATSAYFVAVETTFAHSTTAANSGFAIKGVTGSVIIYGYLTFLNTNPTNAVINNRVSSAATRIPATTTVTAA